MILQVRDRDAFGREIAEWVMNHRTELNLKYVIWGQRIWDPSRDAVAPWTHWRLMKDKKDITHNHWSVRCFQKSLQRLILCL